MAAQRAPAPDPHETRDFLVGIGVGMVAVVAIVLFTLSQLGALGSSELPVTAPRPPRSIDADEVDGPAKPTAVWRFREEWLTPVPKRK